MPSKSQKMHDAMKMAAIGKSTLGIPQSVGKEFIKADKKAGKFQKKGKKGK